MKKKMKALLAGLILIGSTSVSAQEELVFTNGQLYSIGNEEQKSTHQTYFESGQLKATYNLINGVLNGQAIFYNEEGKEVELGFYKDGEKHGKWVKWNDNHQKIAEAHYYFGDKDGAWQIWDDAGTLRYELNYQKGEKTGQWKMYDETGELVSVKEY